MNALTRIIYQMFDLEISPQWGKIQRRPLADVKTYDFEKLMTLKAIESYQNTFL